MAFTNNSKLERHKDEGAETENKLYWCSACDQNICSDEDLKIHMIKHSGDTSYKCYQCNPWEYNGRNCH